MISSYDKLSVREEDAIKLILEFLSRRDLCISQLSLERESGINNCHLSDDLVFLRQLILDGQWDDVLQFVEPLQSMDMFDGRQFKFIIYKHKYIELLCIRSEAGLPNQAVEIAIQEIIECLNQLEKCCPDREAYNSLSSLLTIHNLTDNEELKKWNPNSWRLKCFNDVRTMVEKFMPLALNVTDRMARNDRLMNLVFKGLMYEMCLNSINTKLNILNCKRPDLLNGIDDSLNLNLNDFIQSLPNSLFQYFLSNAKNELTHFENIEKHDKPELVASWSEMILAKPIKPQVFPHTQIPHTRVKAADLMSKSLTASLMLNGNKNLMNMSVCDIAQFSRSTLVASGFHLSNQNDELITKESYCDKDEDQLMTTSVDKLFLNNRKLVVNESGGCTAPTFPKIEEEEELVEGGGGSDGANLTDRGMDESYIDIWKTNQMRKTKHKPVADNVRHHSSRQHFIPPPSSGGIDREDIIDLRSTPNAATSSAVNQQPAIRPVLTEAKEQQHSLWKSSATKPKMMPLTGTVINQQTDKSNIDDTRHGLRSGASSALSTSTLPHHTHRHSESQLSRELSDVEDVQFFPVAKVTDPQAIRTADFHPNGKTYAVGSNSKSLRIYRYLSRDKDKNNNALEDVSLEDAPEPEIIYQRQKYHKGSIYCLSWNKLGNLLATGSNDRTVKVINYDQENARFYNENELTMHDGTVRDMIFMDDHINGSSLLLSGGAGDCKIYITDCETMSPFLSLSGHSGAILSLYTWGGAMFVSGSQDRTIRFWDLRSNSCINLITCPTISRTKPGGAVASVVVDPTGKLMVAGYEDSNCMLYDIRGGRVIQTFHPHSSDVRSIRFSNKAYYLLSGGYDNKIVLTDFQGDLTQPLKSVVVAEHEDKVIQCRWHPSEFTFLSTSADKSAVLWSLPDIN